MRLKLFFSALLFVLPLSPLVSFAADKTPQVSIMHYFTDDLGKAGFNKLLARFEAQTGGKVQVSLVGHEEFKNVVLQMAAEDQLPDVVSYWAGARTQFLVDGGVLAPLDQLWQRRGFSQLVIPALAEGATRYSGQRYLIPFGYHVAGFFYNPQLFKQAGIEPPPATWDELLLACEKLQKIGVSPFALGAKNRWPAQFWFDYLLLRSAGPDFRQQLMTGGVAYTDPKVRAVLERWSGLLKNGYFAPGVTTDDWTDAADRVTAGQAGMTLIGTWVSGYWSARGFRPGADYDFFPFPILDPHQPKVVVGPVDGLVIAAGLPEISAAESLIDFLLTDQQSQIDWAQAQGALSPNRQVSAAIYNPVMKKALQEATAAARFVFAYDLATSPPVAEQGLSLFARLLEAPDAYLPELERTAEIARQILIVPEQ